MIDLSLDDRKKAAIKEIGETLEKYGFRISVEANAVLVPNNDTTVATTGTESPLEL